MKLCRTLLMLTVLMPASLIAGVVFEIETTTYHGGEQETDTSEMLVKDKMLKMAVSGENEITGNAMIYRGDKKELMMIDHGRKVYNVIDEATVRNLASQFGQLNEQLEKALAQVPESQRAMVKEMMEKQMPAAVQKNAPVIDIRKTGETKDVNGYASEKFEVYRDKAKVSELWVTDWSNIKAGNEASGAFREMAKFFKAMMESFESVSGTRNFTDSFFSHMSELNGFPVLSKQFDGNGSVESESRLLSATPRDLQNTQFEPPEGYQRQAMPGLN